MPGYEGTVSGYAHHTVSGYEGTVSGYEHHTVSGYEGTTLCQGMRGHAKRTGHEARQSMEIHGSGCSVDQQAMASLRCQSKHWQASEGGIMCNACAQTHTHMQTHTHAHIHTHTSACAHAPWPSGSRSPATHSNMNATPSRWWGRSHLTSMGSTMIAPAQHHRTIYCAMIAPAQHHRIMYCGMIAPAQHHRTIYCGMRVGRSNSLIQHVAGWHDKVWERGR